MWASVTSYNQVLNDFRSRTKQRYKTAWSKVKHPLTLRPVLEKVLTFAWKGLNSKSICEINFLQRVNQFIRPQIYHSNQSDTGGAESDKS